MEWMLLGIVSAVSGLIGFFLGAYMEYKIWRERGVIPDNRKRRWITNWEAEKWR